MRPDSAKFTADQWREMISQQPLELEVISNSMYPVLKVGDKVIVEPISAPLEKGDVTVYFNHKKSGPQLTVHRHLGNMIFRGDNLLYNDPPIEEAQLVGICTEVIKAGGRQKIAPQPTGLLYKSRLWFKYLKAKIQKRINKLIKKG